MADVEEGSQGPSERKQPAEHDEDDRLLEAQRSTRHALDDDVVTIPGNHGQGQDLTTSHQSAFSIKQ